MTATEAWLKLPDMMMCDFAIIGIDPRVVIRSGGIKVAKVRFHNERRLGKWFEFDADSSTTVILRCEQYDNLVDLVAIDV